MKSYTVTDVGFGSLCTKIFIKKKYIKNHKIIFFIKIKEKKYIRVTKKGITNYLFIKKKLKIC